ncbi:MAG: hypothetical protein JXM70_25025 [Pirellulales bacterium]|nr:hypothetical protein [Pirellulales bacterium]
MNTILTQIALFARSNVFEATRRHAQQHSQLSFSDLVIGVLVFAGLAALLIFILKIFAPPEKPRGVNSPLRLFWDLCRKHELKLSQCWLLWRISREAELKDPALLFVEPELFDPDITGKALAAKRAEIKTLHRRIFGDLS